jgi:hypothetical protein
MRNPRTEAAAQLGGDFEVRVLEPSPPAVTEAPWFADDPLEPGGHVVPVDAPGTRSWSAVGAMRGDTALVTFSMERWLGPRRRLEQLPTRFAATRASLHALAEHVIVPVRHAATGRIGLRWTKGGFGTPFLAGNRQVRVEHGRLLDGDRATTPTSLGHAAAFLGVKAGLPAGTYQAATPCTPDAPLQVDAGAASALGDWFGFTVSLLEQIRSEALPAMEASRPQLWPEHFDLALELSGLRVNLGGSPGDAGHPAPYLYVGPWEPRTGPFWNEPFGASLPYSVLLAAADQRATALEFLRAGRDALSP